MKPRESALRIKRFEADEAARKVGSLESMIREFEQMAADLDRQIAFEEERTGIKDIAHFAYSTFAKAAAQRRDNLKMSVAELRAKLDLAIQERDEAVEKLAKAETSDVRDAGDHNRRRSERDSGAVLG